MEKNNPLKEAMTAADTEDKVGAFFGRPTGAAALTHERCNTHGDWLRQSALAQGFKGLIEESDRRREVSLTPYQREAAEMIAVKLSRILTGNPGEPDHWDDIGGYALLGKGGHDQ